MNPLVSIIMPTYNSDQYISMAIESVLAQTYADWELIISDDGSTDKTEQSVKKFTDPRIRYVKIPHSGSPAVARNHGIKISTGELIAFLDSDDAWKETKLEKQVPHLRDNNIIGVASNSIFIAETPYYRQKNWGKSGKSYVDYQYREILNENPIIASSVLIRKKTLNQSGYFNESNDALFVEDADLWYRMARLGIFRVLEEPLVYYRVRSRKNRFMDISLLENRLKILNWQVARGYIKEAETKEARSLAYLFIARNFLEFDRARSRKFYIEAFKTTMRLRRKFKSLFGYFIASLPHVIQWSVLKALYTIDQACFVFRNGQQKTVKKF